MNQNAKVSMSITAKIIIISSFFSAIFLGASFFTVLSRTRASLLNTALKMSESEAKNHSVRIEDKVKELRKSILILSQVPNLQDLIFAKSSHLPNEAVYKKQIEAFLASQINAYPSLYEKIRIVTVQGDEYVRVNNKQQVGIPIDQKDLQNVSQRAFFTETMKLQQGDVYVSPVELNQEGNPSTISIPYTPVLRIATPLFDTYGDRQGIIVVNLFFQQLSATSIQVSDETSDSFIIDSEGYFLDAPDKTLLWGGPHDLNTNRTSRQYFASVADSFQSQLSGTYIDHQYLYSFSRVYPNEYDRNSFWTIVYKRNSDSVFNLITIDLTIGIIVAVLTFLVLSSLYLFFVRRLLFPLVELNKVASKIGEGNFEIPIVIHSHDEVGLLAQTIKNMSVRLKSMYSDLSQSVEAKTRELQEKVDDLEQVKIATLNLLEDLDEDKTKLQETERQLMEAESIGAFGTFSWDLERNYVIWSDEAFHIYGFEIDPDHVPPSMETYFSRIHPDDRQAAQDSMNLAKSEIGEHENVHRVVLPDGKIIWVHTRSKTIPGVENRPVLLRGTYQDITKEKEVDRMKTEFISLASHQLRTPLSAMKWFSQMLLDGDAGKLTPEQFQYVQHISDSNERMVALVNALLNISRIESGRLIIEPLPTDLGKLLEDVFVKYPKRVTSFLRAFEHIWSAAYVGLCEYDLRCNT